MLLVLAFSAWGQDRRDSEVLERERTQQLRDKVGQRPTVQLGGTQIPWQAPLDDESPCFPVRHIVLAEETADAGAHAWLLRDLDDFTGRCLGARSLEALRTNLDARLLAAGLVTSRVLIPEQNLQSGTLKLALRLGRIGAIDVQGRLGIPVRALGLRVGEVLQLRRVEQALENINRLASARARFELLPGEQADSSLVRIELGDASPWRLNLGLDNAASEDYGRWQWTSSGSWDSPLGQADQLTLYTARNVRAGDGDRRNAVSMLGYSLPLGRSLLSASVSRSTHHRGIQGVSARFVEAGFDTTAQWRWQYNLLRTSTGKLDVSVGGGRRQARTYLDDTELVLQRRRSGQTDLGAQWETQAGGGSLELEYEWSRERAAAPEADFDPGPQLSPVRQRVQASFDRALNGSCTQDCWRYVGRLSWQGTAHANTAADLPSLGSRWSVRGFDGEGLLLGRQAWLLRQELRAATLSVEDLHAQPYVGVDAGRLSGVEVGQGRFLAGTVLGARWQWGRASGDLAVAAPLKRPASMPVSSWHWYASLNCAI